MLSLRAVLIYTEISAKLAIRLKQFAEISYSDNVFTKHCRLIVPGGIYTSCTFPLASVNFLQHFFLKGRERINSPRMNIDLSQHFEALGI